MVFLVFWYKNKHAYGIIVEKVGRSMKRGFTIIEVVLVLAVSSLFAVGMFAGWNNNIEKHRYEDALNTLKSDIQAIFDDVQNPNRPVERASSACGAASSDQRGSSNCILLGRLVVFSPSGRGSIAVHDIVGDDIDINTACNRRACANHLEALAAARFRHVVGGPNSRTITSQWNYRIRNITDNRTGQLFGRTAGSPSASQFIIVRSPIDGTILTLASPGSETITASTTPVAARNAFLDTQRIMNDTKKINICLQQSTGRNLPITNRVIRIGGTAASVEVATLDGAGSYACGGNDSGFDDVVLNGRRV